MRHKTQRAKVAEHSEARRADRAEDGLRQTPFAVACLTGLVDDGRKGPRPLKPELG